MVQDPRLAVFSWTSKMFQNVGPVCRAIFRVHLIKCFRKGPVKFSLDVLIQGTFDKYFKTGLVKFSLDVLISQDY